MANLVSIPALADQMVPLGPERAIHVQKPVVLVLLSSLLLLFIAVLLVRDFCRVVLGNTREHLQDGGVLSHGKIVVFRAQMKAFRAESGIRNQKVVPFLRWCRRRTVLVAGVVGHGVGGPSAHGDGVKLLVCLCINDLSSCLLLYCLLSL